MAEQDYETLRQEMVSGHLVGRGIKDPLVLAAFRKVPREKFVPVEYRVDSYGDFPLPIGYDQTISQPYIVALMMEALSLKRTDKLLEIGTGSGYQTALLTEVVSFVYSIERIPNLAERAEEILKELGYANFEIKFGDGTSGWQEHAPFDVVLVSAGANKAPASLLNQLALSGRMIIPEGNHWSQDLTLYRKTPSGITSRSLGGCRFVPLIGKEGWESM
ncbi:MAG: protein-L-isoaspartate(D-aspartate) O-methyltransferase [Candidatus Omnitrophota bacterium]